VTKDSEALQRLLTAEEGQYFERKSLMEGPPGKKKPRDRAVVRGEVARNVAAFANADGGTLVLGIEDGGEITGHSYPPPAVDAILNVPRNRLNPPLAPGGIERVDDKEILVFDVEAAPRAVMVIGDGFPRREGDQVIPTSEEVINRIKDAGLIASPEARIAGAVTLHDLDAESLRRTMREAGFEGSAEDYLVKRRLADRRGDVLALRQGAVWLFGRDVEIIEHPNIAVRVFRVDGTEQRTGAARNVQDFPWIEGNLLSMLDRAYALLRTLIHSSARLHDLFFREAPKYPTFAWQEALVNALAHRDYGLGSQCVEVWLFDDRMEVHSPGGLLPEVPIEALRERRRVHASRNPRIARVLTELGVMRQQGEGIPRMIEEMELAWLPPPEFLCEPGSFRVVLHNEPVFVGADEEWVVAVRRLPLDVRQKRALVAFHDRPFQNGDYQQLNRVDRDQAYRELLDLENRGLIAAGGATRGRRYRVQPDAAGAAAAPASPLRWLQRRMDEAGRITNIDYREAFGVERPEATRRLGELVRGGYLVLAGEKRGAHYLPGPAWPPPEE
jgi:ATP-dependent DNA helicase RecG